MPVGYVLDSHTPETALQELADIVLAVAVVARVRAASTELLEVPPCRVSLRKLVPATRSEDSGDVGISIVR